MGVRAGSAMRAFFATALLCAGVGFADKISEQLTLRPGDIFTRLQPVYKGKTAYISFDLQLSRTDAHASDAGAIEANILHRSQWDATPLDCCTEFVRTDDGSCGIPDMLKISPNSSSVFTRIGFFEPGEQTIRIEGSMPVTKTGIHFLFISSCSASTQNVYVTGTSTWRNWYGYLPGQLYGFLGFFLALTVVYALLFFVWTLAVVINWEHMHTLQKFITVCLFTSFVCSLLWYLAYRMYNAQGHRPRTFLWGVVLADTGRKLVSRMLVLLVGLGYGVTTLSLEHSQWLLIGASSCAYYVATAVATIATRVVYLSEPLSVGAKIGLVLPEAVMNGIIFTWILVALQDTTAALQEKGQSRKYALYAQLQTALVAFCSLSLAWMLYGMLINMKEDPYMNYWSSQWARDGLWDVLYLLVLIAIMCMAPPSENATRYAYATQLAGDEDDVEMEDLDVDADAAMDTTDAFAGIDEANED